MTITTHHRSLTTYTELTASMQTDPEARHHGGAPGARLSTAHMEWVPDRERRVVPDMMAALCRRCPARQSCLLWALAGQEQGYWAGTTSNDREIMLQLDQDDVDTADWLQDLARNEFTDGALHPTGEGSYFWYRRRGCRCGECKSANAHARAQERAKAKEKAA